MDLFDFRGLRDRDRDLFYLAENNGEKFLNQLNRMLPYLSDVIGHELNLSLQFLCLVWINVVDGVDLDIDPLDNKGLGLHTQYGDLSLDVFSELGLNRRHWIHARHLGELLYYLELLPETSFDFINLYFSREAS